GDEGESAAHVRFAPKADKGMGPFGKSASLQKQTKKWVLSVSPLDLARFGELAGIAEEIEQDLPQPHGVHGQCAEVLLDINDEAVLVLLGQRVVGRAENHCQRGLPDRFWVGVQLSGASLRQGQHLVEN